jgi:hypothetical protein
MQIGPQSLRACGRAPIDGANEFFGCGVLRRASGRRRRYLRNCGVRILVAAGGSFQVFPACARPEATRVFPEN